MITRVAKVFLLFSNNNEGKRYSLPNSRIMIHQPLGGAQGGQTDIDIQVCSFSFPFLCLLLEHPNALYLSSPLHKPITQHSTSTPSPSAPPPTHPNTPSPSKSPTAPTFFIFLITIGKLSPFTTLVRSGPCFFCQLHQVAAN